MMSRLMISLGHHFWICTHPNSCIHHDCIGWCFYLNLNLDHFLIRNHRLNLVISNYLHPRVITLSRNHCCLIVFVIARSWSFWSGRFSYLNYFSIQCQYYSVNFTTSNFINDIYPYIYCLAAYCFGGSPCLAALDFGCRQVLWSFCFCFYIVHIND